MNTNQRSLKVFLCHAHADRDSVHKLYDRLIKDGVDAWLDKEKLIPGQDWRSEIRKAVCAADVVVVCLSSHFNQTGFRQREVRFALDTAMEKAEGEIFIIPARLEECETPEDLAKWQWVDLFEPDGYERLRRALRARAEKIGVTIKKSITLPYKIRSNTKSDTPQIENLFANPKKLPSSRETPRRKRNTAITIALIGLAGTLVTALLTSPLIEKWLFPDVIPTQTFEPTITQDPVATSVGPTGQITMPPTGDPTRASGLDGMSLILIPAGEFQMGSVGTVPDEQPVHTVYLGAYFIDQTEVTNSMYALCVEQGKCEAPTATTSITQNESNGSFYYGNPEFDNYPVVYVSWDAAKAYCQSVGRRLPTEAEWEKAASWDAQKGIKRTYPWGNYIDCYYANFYGGKTLCVGDTSPVGSYPQGASSYGALDMAGNVWEWVVDRYDSKYYGDSPQSNPTGPASGNSIVIRGGSFLVGAAVVRSSERNIMLPDNTSHNVGFRCSMSATP